MASECCLERGFDHFSLALLALLLVAIDYNVRLKAIEY